MTNIEKLREAQILKDYTELTAAEVVAVEDLDEEELELAIETHDPPLNIVNTLFPLAGIGFHHVVGNPDEETEP